MTDIEFEGKKVKTLKIVGTSTGGFFLIAITEDGKTYETWPIKTEI
jgi:hypothetical protein